MKNRIAKNELEKSIGEIVKAVDERGETFIVEDAGKAVAAIVPVQVSENQDRKRRELYELIEKVREQNRDVQEDVAEMAITEAIVDVRGERRKKSTAA